MHRLCRFSSTRNEFLSACDLHLLIRVPTRMRPLFAAVPCASGRQ